jgi:vancomycin resistance protein YoaR
MNVAPTLSTSKLLSANVKRAAHRTTREKVSYLATIGLMATFGLFLVGIAAFSAYGFRYADRVYPGLSVAGVDLSGMTRDEVSVAVQDRYVTFSETPITLTASEQSFEVSLTELGISLDEEATVDEVMEYGRSGSWWDRSIAWSQGVLHGNDLEPLLTVDAEIFSDAMNTLAPGVVFAPSDARVDLTSSGEATLVDDVAGLSINVTATREKAIDQLASMEPSPISISLVSAPASVRAADLQAGLPYAQRAVSSAVLLNSEDGTWGLSRSALGELVWVDSSGKLQVRQDGVENYVQGVAAQIDHPVEDAGITVDESGAFVVVPQVNSATVDIGVTTDRLVTAIENGSTSVDIEVARTEPGIQDATAQSWADQAEALVGDGLELTWNGGASQLGRADLIAALVIEPRPDDDEQFALYFDEEMLAERLAPLEEDLYVEQQEAQFRLVNDQIRFQSEAKQGRELNVGDSIEAVLGAIDNGDDTVALAITSLEPEYTRGSRGSILLPDVLGQSQTYYGDSSDPRRENVERASQIEDGWLIPPDGVFSFAEFMGLVNEANGFVTGYGIVADENGGVTTAPVIGGGICQVSTTIYQAAFWAGLPIVERWAHPYWIRTYGQPPYGVQGLDAMVNIEPDWALDLKFRNNTGDWIALVMVADGENVSAEIRGTNPGWEIDVPEPTVTDVIEPEDEMVFYDSTELPRGEELQVEHAREGFTSTITRTVRDADGNIVDEYSYESTYSASRNTTLRGVGAAEDN